MSFLRSIERRQQRAARGAPGLFLQTFYTLDWSGVVGVSIVEATDHDNAVKVAWRRKCNPGGNVQTAGPMPAERAALVPEEYRHRLLTVEEAYLLDTLAGCKGDLLPSPAPAHGAQCVCCHKDIGQKRS